GTGSRCPDTASAPAVCLHFSSGHSRLHASLGCHTNCCHHCHSSSDGTSAHQQFFHHAGAVNGAGGRDSPLRYVSELLPGYCVWGEYCPVRCATLRGVVMGQETELNQNAKQVNAAYRHAWSLTQAP